MRSDRDALDGLVTVKDDDRETLGAAIWKQTSKKLDTPGYSWRHWLSTEVLGGIMLAAYAPGETTKALIN